MMIVVIIMSSYSEMIVEVLGHVNTLRRTPGNFAHRLEQIAPEYKPNNARHRQGDVPVMTREGVEAVHEAIDLLRSTDPMDALELSVGLSNAAQLHANDTGKAGIVGHIGSRENSLQDRLDEQGRWNDCIAEALDYGSIEGFEIISSLFIDDGLSTRPHRNALINPRFKKVGIGLAPHSEYKTVTCIVFAGDFVDKEGIRNVQPPEGGVRPIPEVEGWVDGAVKLTCEIRSETDGGKTVKKVKKYWEMHDGSTQITEDLVEESKGS